MMMSEFQLWWFCSSNLVLIVYSYSLPKVPNHYIDKNLVHFFFSLHPPFPASFVCVWKSHHFIPSWHHQSWVCCIKMPCKPYFSGTSASVHIINVGCGLNQRCGFILWSLTCNWTFLRVKANCLCAAPLCQHHNHITLRVQPVSVNRLSYVRSDCSVNSTLETGLFVL